MGGGHKVKTGSVDKNDIFDCCCVWSLKNIYTNRLHFIKVFIFFKEGGVTGSVNRKWCNNFRLGGWLGQLTKNDVTINLGVFCEGESLGQLTESDIKFLVLGKQWVSL